MSQECDGWASDCGALLPRDSVLPRLVRCLCGFLDEQPCCLLLVTVKCTEVVEVAVKMTSDRRVSRSCSGRRPAKTASRIIP